MFLINATWNTLTVHSNDIDKKWCSEIDRPLEFRTSSNMGLILKFIRKSGKNLKSTNCVTVQPTKMSGNFLKVFFDSNSFEWEKIFKLEEGEEIGKRKLSTLFLYFLFLMDVSVFFRRGGRCTFGSNRRQTTQTWAGNICDNCSDLRDSPEVSSAVFIHTSPERRRYKTLTRLC